MFDLNEAIARWRTNLAAGGACGKSDLDELEAHLREEIENLTALKLSEEESFLVAKHRLGQPASLAREFAKINRLAVWSHRLLWVALGLFMHFLVSHFVATAFWRWLALINRASGMVHTRSLVMGCVLHLGLLGTVYFALYRAARVELSGLSFVRPAGKFRRILSFFSRLFLLVFTIYIFRAFGAALTLPAFDPWLSESWLAWLALLGLPSWIHVLLVPAVWAVLVVMMRPLEPQRSEE